MKRIVKEDGKVTFLLLIAILVIIVCLGAYCYSVLNNVEPVNNEEVNTVVEEPKEETNTTSEVTNTSSSHSELKPVENMSSEMFSYEFLKLENEDASKENIIYSPLSIKYALKLLVEGADGETEKQIRDIIGDGDITTYENQKDILSLANAIYIRESFKDMVLDSYTEKVENDYKAEIKFDEFKDAKNVNDWISEKTFGIIEKLLDDSMVQNPNLEMLLINALAIDMKWKLSFDTNNTFGGKFDEDNQNITVAYMSKGETKSESYSYKITDDVTVLSMDLKEYGDVQLEFDAIMPNEKSLSEFIDELDNKKVDEYLADLICAKEENDGINIRIPKFDFDYSIRLKDELKAMGMVDAFDGQDADFSKMVKDNCLYVSEAIHKADIEFSEEGIRAAAVTVFAMEMKRAIMDPTHPVDVIIDKPFMFIIRDKNTGETWFVGTVNKPILWDDVKAEYQARF